MEETVCNSERMTVAGGHHPKATQVTVKFTHLYATEVTKMQTILNTAAPPVAGLVGWGSGWGSQ